MRKTFGAALGLACMAGLLAVGQAPGTAAQSGTWKVYVGQSDSFAFKYNKATKRYRVAGWTNVSDGSWCFTGRRSQGYYYIRGTEKFFGEGYPKPIRSKRHVRIVANKTYAFMDTAHTSHGGNVVRVEGNRSYDPNTLKYMKRLAARC